MAKRSGPICRTSEFSRLPADRNRGVVPRVRRAARRPAGDTGRRAFAYGWRPLRRSPTHVQALPPTRRGRPPRRGQLEDLLSLRAAVLLAHGEGRVRRRPRTPRRVVAAQGREETRRGAAPEPSSRRLIARPPRSATSHDLLSKRTPRSPSLRRVEGGQGLRSSGE